MTQETEPKPSMKIAIQGLMDALDRSPRNMWPQVMEMALNSVHQLGYTEGYRQGALFEANRATPEAPLPGKPSEILAAEDKTLTNEKVTAEEQLEDLGHEFIRQIARQIGLIAKLHDVTPGAVIVRLGVPVGDRHSVIAPLEIEIKNPTGPIVSSPTR